MLEVLSLGHTGPWLGHLLVDGVGVFGFGALIAYALARAAAERRRGRQAEAAFDPLAPLAPGETVVAGKVEHAPGHDVAFRVEVAQTGTESESSGTWSHVWREVGRQVTVAPFYLSRATGDRVRVEPERTALLVDELDGIVRIDLEHRRRVAELTPGEHVFAFGELREIAEPVVPPPGGRPRTRRGFALGPPRHGPLLLSSEALGARFLARAATHRGLAWAAVIAAALFHLSVSPFHARRLLGRDETGVVLEKRIDEHTDGDGDLVRSCVVRLRVAGAEIEEEVSRGDFPGISPGQALPVRHVPLLPAASVLGPAGTIHGASGAAVLFFLLLLGAYRAVPRMRRPWYESPVTDPGSGRLRESKP